MSRPPVTTKISCPRRIAGVFSHAASSRSVTSFFCSGVIALSRSAILLPLLCGHLSADVPVEVRHEDGRRAPGTGIGLRTVPFPGNYLRAPVQGVSVALGPFQGIVLDLEAARPLFARRVPRPQVHRDLFLVHYRSPPVSCLSSAAFFSMCTRTLARSVGSSGSSSGTNAWRQIPQRIGGTPWSWSF